jgi:TonB family protein
MRCQSQSANCTGEKVGYFFNDFFNFRVLPVWYSIGGIIMPAISKARYFILYSLLFISIVCQSFAAFGNSLKKTEPGNLQIAESDNPREIWKKTFSASQRVKSYRIRIEIPSVSNAVTIMEYASPNRVHRVRENEEFIWIGKDTYYKKGDDSWEKYSEDSQVSDSPVTALAKFIRNLAKAEEVKLIGQETVDGIPTLVYQHLIRFNTEPFMMKTWIGIADGLLRRCEFDTTSGSIKSSAIHTYYDYNADIKIEPPAKYISVPLPVEGLAPLPTNGLPGEGSGTGSGVGSGRGGNTGSNSDLNPDGSAKSVDSRPIPMTVPRPGYTKAARNNKTQGNVKVRALVGADGFVKQVRVVSGLPDGLTEEAILAAKKMRFKPATKNGQPVAYWTFLEVEFNLR